MEADLTGAEELLLEALQARRETLGERHPDTIASISNSGMLLKDKGDLARAEELCACPRRALAAPSPRPTTRRAPLDRAAAARKRGDADLCRVR